MSERLSIINDNNLRYDGKILWADVLPIPYRSARKAEYMSISPADLEIMLHYGEAFVRAALQNFYCKQKAALEPKGYTVERPSLFVAKLGSSNQTDGQASDVYSAMGYANGGIHWNIDEQHPAFASHWHAVENAGFYPHVRGTISPKRLGDGGAFLMLRDIDER